MTVIKHILIYATFFYILHVQNGVMGYCAMYGQCNYNSSVDKIQNCYQEYNTMPPATLNTSHASYSDAVAQLKSYCSYYFYDDDGNEKGKSS